ncbi:hypothetical protein Trydic_g8258 [Trypoxylus dichotomus]
MLHKRKRGLDLTRRQRPKTQKQALDRVERAIWHSKCACICQAQDSRKKSAHFEAADTTNSSHLEVLTEGIRSQLSGKSASEMPGNYQCRW